MIRIGLLGASRIARGAIIKPAATTGGVSVTTVAARSFDRAKDYAREHGIKSALPNYEALIQSPDVDLVYNGLPPSEHARWTIAALEAGKHVLCEKPFAMTSTEAEDMVAAADRTERVLLEAFHYRFHPLFFRVLKILGSGAIGTIQTVNAHFSVPIKCSDTEIRYKPELGGGALMDLGCYPVHWVRTLMQSEPTVKTARREMHASGVDVATVAELEFPGGETARVSCAMNEDLEGGLDARLSVIGTDGRLEVENPLAPHDGNRITLTNARGLVGEDVEGDTTYHYQLEHMLRLIDGTGERILPLDDAVNNMRAIEAIVAAARE